MNINRICLFLSIPTFMSACAEHSGRQTLAPVYESQPVTVQNIKPYRYPNVVSNTQPDTDQKKTTIANTRKVFFPKTTETFARAGDNVNKSAPLLPAVTALMNDAANKRKSGDLEGAVSSLERALRIDSRSALLTYKLAQLRASQTNFDLAENLSKKAALLAGNDGYLKKLCWLLIAKARDSLNNVRGAKEARLKAASFF